MSGSILSRLAKATEVRAAVLIYHSVGRTSPDPLHVSVSAELFAAQMAELRRGWNPLPLADVLSHLGAGTLPERAVAVTFDDGYADNLYCALPILREHAIPATVFVTAGYLDGKREFWWDDLQRIMYHAGSLAELRNGIPTEWRAGFPERGNVAELFRHLHEKIRELEPERIDSIVGTLRDSIGLVRMDPREEVRPLRREELIQLRVGNLVEVGAHTVHHSWLATLDPNRQLREMTESKSILEESVGVPVPYFAYPYGRRASVTLASLQQAACAGFAAAFANEKGSLYAASDRFWIPRITPGEEGGRAFSERIQMYCDRRDAPKAPPGYNSSNPVVKKETRMAFDGGRLFRKGASWLRNRWKEIFSGKTGKKKKLRIPILTKAWARYRLGNGMSPLSVVAGNERGTPLQRYYIERYFEGVRGDIRGHVLEFRNDDYATRYGGTQITRLDILHKEGSGTSKHATILADLTRPNDIPSDTFDCIICTHTLHIIKDLATMNAEMRRILKPGGVLLVAVPMVDMIEPWWHELWRFTPEGMFEVLADTFGRENVSVKGYGNSLIAAAAMRGLTAEEFSGREMDFCDDRFTVEVCARAVKR